ncbi:hypothetical protein BRC81_08415 [Halobacteriales archaeon QS_1_68_20]|nr:MAG: hypothetical protein BRC81_08415 [Halobacteriales archaeon QS_1_68_20]
MVRRLGGDADALADSPWQIAGTDGHVVDLAGRVLVTSAGLLSEVELEVTIERGDGEVVSEVFRYEVDPVDEGALERPDWTEAAPHVTASYGENDTALVLTHRGGAAIPEGTELRLVADGEVLGTATVPERIEPGQRLYAVVAVTNSSRTLHLQAGERPSVDEHKLSLQKYDGVVAVGDGEGEGSEFEAATPVR